MDQASNRSWYARRLKRRAELRISRQLETGVAGSPTPEDAPASPAGRLAAQLWASSVAAAVHCSDDPKTVAAWCGAAGIGPRTLRARCRAAGVPVRSSLQFCRVLRGVVLASRLRWHLDDVLSDVGERTMRTLLLRARIRRRPFRHPSIGEFLRWQQFTRCRLNLDAVVDEVSRVLESWEARRVPDAPPNNREP